MGGLYISDNESLNICTLHLVVFVILKSEQWLAFCGSCSAVLSSEQEPICCERHKADHRVLVECWMFAALGWICSGVLTRMVTLWICLNRFTVQSAPWMTLHYITSALLKNNWIYTKSHGHSVRPDASCDSAGLIVCPVYLRVFFVYSQVCEVCPLEFLGSTVVYTFVLDEWWGFPVYISQLCMPAIAAWAERPAGSIYKPYSHMEQLRPATRSFNRSQLTVSFSPQRCTAAWDIFHFGICGKIREDVLHTCDV